MGALEDRVNRAAQHALALPVDDAHLEDARGSALGEVLRNQVFDLTGRKVVQVELTVDGDLHRLRGIEVVVEEIGVEVTVTVVSAHGQSIPPAQDFC